MRKIFLVLLLCFCILQGPVSAQSSSDSWGQMGLTELEELEHDEQKRSDYQAKLERLHRDVQNQIGERKYRDLAVKFITETTKNSEILRGAERRVDAQFLIEVAIIYDWHRKAHGTMLSILGSGEARKFSSEIASVRNKEAGIALLSAIVFMNEKSDLDDIEDIIWQYMFTEVEEYPPIAHRWVYRTNIINAMMRILE